jgi:hypothetical protein
MAMTLDAEAFLRRLWALDELLVGKGFHRISPWWRRELERFVRALAGGDRAAVRRWVIRAGRRAGKSSTLCRLAVAWGLWGSWHVPAGDIAVVAFVSVSKDESSARLRTIAEILRALGVPFEPRGEEVEVTGSRPVVFRTIAATTKAGVGFTAIVVMGDEVSRWESRDSAANPAREVLGSLFPTLASQPFGFSVLCSSPWSTDDYHSEIFSASNTDHQITSFGATWQCNPTITEERTHELEPCVRTWQREYAALPGATVSAAVDSGDVKACVGLRPNANATEGFIAIDASSLRADAFTYIAGTTTEAAELVVREVGGWDGEALRSVSMRDVVRTIAERAKRWRASVVYGDQREEASLRSLFSEERVGFTSYAWSEPSKDDAMQLLRRLMRERRLCLPDDDRLVRQLVNLKAHLAPSGRVRYLTNGQDYASALITLAHAIVAGDFIVGRRASVVYAGGQYIDLAASRRSHHDPFEPPLHRDSGSRFGGIPGRGF